jgi:hypothetical protein
MHLSFVATTMLVLSIAAIQLKDVFKSLKFVTITILALMTLAIEKRDVSSPQNISAMETNAPESNVTLLPELSSTSQLIATTLTHVPMTIAAQTPDVFILK